MAKIRTVKPELFRHEELFNAEKKSKLPLRLAFIGMFTVADREGRFKWKPNELKADVLLHDKVDFAKVMDTLAEYGFLLKYEVDGKTYGCIPSFTNHQKIRPDEAKSVIPKPPVSGTIQTSNEPVTNPVGCQESGSGTGIVERKGKERKGKEHIHVGEAVCRIFGKSYLEPPDRMPAEGGWYQAIDYQVDKILELYPADIAVKQINAYIKHCKNTDRKLIATNHKVFETIQSIDWIKISEPDNGLPRDGPYSEAENNKKLWTDEAWRKQYDRQIRTDSGFRKHFQITQ